MSCSTRKRELLFTAAGGVRGRVSLEAAEAVCGASLDKLSALRRKEPCPAARRPLRLLETIRAYATELFDQSGQRDDLRRKHAEYLAGFCDE